MLLGQWDATRSVGATRSVLLGQCYYVSRILLHLWDATRSVGCY